MNHQRAAARLTDGHTPLHRTIALVALILAPPAIQAQAPLPPGASIRHAQATARDGKLLASVEGQSPLSCAELAAVFADFESMPAFVPGLSLSRVVSRGPGWAIIQQSGTLSVGPFSKAFSSERKVLFDLPSRIDSSSTGQPGEPQLASSTLFSPDKAGCLARYDTQVDISTWAPGALAESVAKSNATIQMAAMLREAHRRHGAIGASPAPRDTEHPIHSAEPLDGASASASTSAPP